ncbi:MAG: methyltransferase domain-containing protein [Psychroserpens sp.]|uniref:methyltransferase domain-containing protein n=1 Tax=Psychroserpens sp. TaxID=2020870 RepID=UPI00300153E6
MKNLNGTYWDSRYNNNDEPWDLGEVSPPIKAYVDQLTNKSLRILIPGGGNSYEAEYLFNSGFKNVFVVDVSKTALDNIKNRVPDFPSEQLVHQDFFKFNMIFDLILEQTFFCALNPDLRPQYVSKMNDLLSENGKLVGLLFNVLLFSDHPPFGGSKEEYIEKFNSFFDILLMEEAYNSHITRVGRELFFKLKKNSDRII